MTKQEQKRLAEALLDPSSTAQYLLGRLGDLDEAWDEVTPAVLMKLGTKYGAAVVTDALRAARIAELAARNPVGWLEAVCREMDRDSLRVEQV